MGNINHYKSRLNKHLSIMVIDYERIDIGLSLHVYNIHLHSFWYNLDAILNEHFSQNEDLFLLFANELKKYTAFIIRYNTI